MAKTEVLAITSGSRPLKNASHELYAHFRAQALPRIQAYREVGWHSKKNDVAAAGPGDVRVLVGTP
jgi:hypothetical protein